MRPYGYPPPGAQIGMKLSKKYLEYPSNEPCQAYLSLKFVINTNRNETPLN